jgi:hypothetical protein
LERGAYDSPRFVAPFIEKLDRALDSFHALGVKGRVQQGVHLLIIGGVSVADE